MARYSQDIDVVFLAECVGKCEYQNGALQVVVNDSMECRPMKMSMTLFIHKGADFMRNFDVLFFYGNGNRTDRPIWHLCSLGQTNCHTLFLQHSTKSNSKAKQHYL